MATYSTFDLQVYDLALEKGTFGTGGKAIVCLAGTYTLATLYNPDNDYAALSQPVSLSRGKLRFAIATGVSGQTTQPAVDVYGTAPGGQAFQRYNVATASPPEININSGILNQHMVVPFSFAQGTPASVVDLGLDFPARSVIQPFPSIDVVTLESAKTLDVGLLASESGGDEDGFIVAISLAAAGAIVPKWVATSTVGALLLVSTATTPAVLTERHHPIASAVSLTWTISAASVAAKGRIIVPYVINPG